MADIRINALATTAASTASDDFIAVDGSANGTRKLNAYSPTFGGNLTVSGTGTTGGNLRVRNALGYATGIHTGTTSDSTQQLLLSSNAAYNHAYISKGSTTLGIGFSSDNGSFVADDSITITAATKLVTLTGNLTVSGTGTSSVAGKLQLGATTATGYNTLLESSGITTGRGVYQITNNSAWLIAGIEGSVGGTSLTGSTAYASFLGSFTATPLHLVSNGTIGATLTSGGNVLIGTTTDGGQKLQVSGSAAIGNSSTTTAVRLALDGVGTTGNVPVIQFKSAGTAKGYVGLAGGFLGTTSTDMMIATDAAGASIKFIPGDSATTALTLDSSQNATFAGTVTTSTTNSSQNAGIGNKFISSGAVWVVNAATNDAFSYYNSSAAAYRFYVDSGGTISATNTAISAISDARLKENVRDLSGGLSSILALKPRVFDWKEGKGANKKNVRGFIAQEIEQVFPDLVDEWKDAAPEGEAPYKSVRQDLIPVLVKAIQELTARVVALENA